MDAEEEAETLRAGIEVRALESLEAIARLSNASDLSIEEMRDEAGTVIDNARGIKGRLDRLAEIEEADDGDQAGTG